MPVHSSPAALIGSANYRDNCSTTSSVMGSLSWQNFWMMNSLKLSPQHIKAINSESLAQGKILDELRVLIRDKHGITAFFCFSTQIKGLTNCDIYGPAGSMVADIITGSLIRIGKQAYKSYLTYFIPPLKSATGAFRNARRNITNLLAAGFIRTSG